LVRDGIGQEMNMGRLEAGCDEALAISSIYDCIVTAFGVRPSRIIDVRPEVFREIVNLYEEGKPSFLQRVQGPEEAGVLPEVGIVYMNQVATGWEGLLQSSFDGVGQRFGTFPAALVRRAANGVVVEAGYDANGDPGGLIRRGTYDKYNLMISR
jgi:hypothetical protein